MNNYDVIYSSVARDLSVASDKQLTIAQIFDALGEKYGADIKAKFYNGKMLVKVAEIENPDHKLGMNDLVPGSGDIILIASEEKGGNFLIKIVSHNEETSQLRSTVFDVSKIETAEVVVEGYDHRENEKEPSENLNNITMTVGEMKKHESSCLTIVTSSGEAHIFDNVPSLRVFTKETFKDKFVPGEITLIAEI